MTESLYVPLGGGKFRATGLTQGPWNPRHQHGSPPAALLARALELADERPDLSFVQFALDLLGPIPVGEVEVHAEVVRDGRRVQCIAGEMIAEGRPVAYARGWRVRRADTLRVASGEDPAPLERPEKAEVQAPFREFGYFDALEWRFAAGQFLVSGPATLWTRLLVPVVPDEQPSPLQRLVGVADVASGVSHELDFDTYTFTNVDFALHLLRPLAGEWVCLDAATTIGPEGSGLARTKLYDDQGSFGSLTQTLFVGRRD